MKENELWIVDDVQQIVNVKSCEIIPSPPGAEQKLVINAPESHSGMIFSTEFVYTSEDAAEREVADRHTRLNQAFSKRDLLACLSINKEPGRKTGGATAKDLVNMAEHDKESYHRWVSNLTKEWEAINHEKADLQKLSQTLRNARLIQDALANPLAIDFTEIMAREAVLKAHKPPGPSQEM
jgi:hypothetical protein